MNTHSRGPWRCGSQVHRTIYAEATNGKGRLRGLMDTPEDARRVVAALNACEGTSTEDLEAGPGPVAEPTVVEAGREVLAAADKVLKNARAAGRSDHRRINYELCDAINVQRLGGVLKQMAAIGLPADKAREYASLANTLLTLLRAENDELPRTP